MNVNDKDYIPTRNAEHYADPTAYQALKNIENENKEKEYHELTDYERFRKLLDAMHILCRLSEFRIVEHIVLEDKRTGKIWR